ncbi:MAG TPA: hypothetical protein VIA18_32520 [Polyangia bacterium]|nr:hypothetical protein [Polyangia bacterium]
MVSNHAGPFEQSQLKLLAIEVALKEHKKADAEKLALLLGSPFAADPNVLVRVRALLGPLWKLKP